ncbi:MAG: restriction endonuclease subunit S [Bacteroidales bacterium]|nr:restriction endonuclease subunit S [Bacteroidales bacterium]
MVENKDKKVLNAPHLRFPEFGGEWEECKLEDCVDFLDGLRKPIKSEERKCEKGLYPYYGASGIIDYIDEYIFDGDYILLSEDGANILDRNYRVAFLAKGKIWVNNHAHVLLPHTNIDIDFLSEALERLNYAVYNTGTTMPKLNQEICRKIGLHIPSTKEQNKIGALLSLLNERIATQNKIIEKYESLIQAICDTLIEAEQHKVELSFNDFGEPYSGLSGKSAEDFGKGWPYITYMNVYQNQIIDITDVGLVKINETEQQSVVRYGDILFTLSSETPDEVGMGAVYLGDAYPLYLNSFCFGVHITDESKIFPPFLAYYISTKSFRKAVFPLAQGSTRFNLQKNDFMKKIFHFPTVKKQSEIYSVLKAYSNKLSIEKNIANLLCEQKSYLLRQLFI